MPPSKAALIAPSRTTSDTKEAQARMPIYILNLVELTICTAISPLAVTRRQIGAHQQVSGHALGDAGIQCDRLAYLRWRASDLRSMQENKFSRELKESTPALIFFRTLNLLNLVGRGTPGY